MAVLHIESLRPEPEHLMPLDEFLLRAQLIAIEDGLDGMLDTAEEES